MVKAFSWLWNAWIKYLLLFLEHYIQERIKPYCLNLLHLLVDHWRLTCAFLQVKQLVFSGVRTEMQGLSHGPTVLCSTLCNAISPSYAWWSSLTVGQVTTIVCFGQHCIAFGMSHILNVADTCSVAKSCLTLCEPMSCSTPGFPVLHYLLELAHTHAHWVSNAI